MSVRTVYTCDQTRKAGKPGDYDLDVDLDTPLGWLEVTITRVVNNPDYGEAVREAEEELALMDQQLAGQGLDEETRAVTLAPVRAQREAMYPPQYAVQERVMHFHPEAVDDVLTALGVGGMA